MKKGFSWRRPRNSAAPSAVFLLTTVNTGKVDQSLPRPEDQPKRIFGITHPNTSHRFIVLCLDRDSGKELWRRVATEKIPHEGHHRDNNFASASPVTDGKRLYCWFGSAGLFCYDLDGKLLWERNLGKVHMGASLGEGTSPVVYDGKVVLVRDHQKQSYIETLDAATGETMWRKNRDEENTWATPAIVRHSGRTQVITPGSKRIRSYDLDTGEIIWQCGGLTGNPIPCPVVDGDRVICMTGYEGHSVLAIKLDSRGDITDSEQIAWSRRRGTPYIPSPLLYDGLLYFNQSNQQMWTCLDSDTGEIHFDRERLPGLFNIYSSPVGADGRIYVTDRNGTTIVLKRDRELTVLATNKLDDTINSSPALAGEQLFLRGSSHLYCLSTKRPLRQDTTLTGKVTDADGTPMGGVMISAFDEDHRKWISVFSRKDGSFAIDGLRDKVHQVRARLMGKLDEWFDDVRPGRDTVVIQIHPATGFDLEEQRPADSGFSMLAFDNMRDKLNFKMFCTYCHQVGTVPFRSPEEPVDWETMLRRMDGFGGLYPHTQETIIPKLIATYKDDAVDQWPSFEPPPPPSGTAAKVKITAWEFGKQFESSFHDLEPGPDGLVYVVNISKHYMGILDTKTGEQTIHKMPKGSWGPHSIEPDLEGHMWITLCASGQMGKFDINTGKLKAYSSAEAPARRGSYPHTLRVNPADPEGLIWYTDAGRNSVFSMHPKTKYVKEYHLLSEGQAVAAGKGESRGITPYGLDYSPIDGMIWYSKLNGNRIGRIDPNQPDGDIKEWNPPFRGPRRLHVAQDGVIWVPGFGSGVLGKFDPVNEEWTVYALPDAENQIPYALNIDPKGFVWVCGTGNDTINRFDPETERWIEIRLPMRVSYTREIEFDEEGNVWTSTSGPSRHMERALGQIIKIEILEDDSDGVKLARVNLSEDELGSLTAANKPAPIKERRFRPLPKNGPPQPRIDKAKLGKLFTRIESNALPKGYEPWLGNNAEESSRLHQAYVDKRMAGLTDAQRGRIGQLWQQRHQLEKKMQNAGASFVKIMEYVANKEK